MKIASRASFFFDVSALLWCITPVTKSNKPFAMKSECMKFCVWISSSIQGLIFSQPAHTALFGHTPVPKKSFLERKKSAITSLVKENSIEIYCEEKCTWLCSRPRENKAGQKKRAKVFIFPAIDSDKSHAYLASEPPKYLRCSFGGHITKSKFFFPITYFPKISFIEILLFISSR